MIKYLPLLSLLLYCFVANAQEDEGKLQEILKKTKSSVSGSFGAIGTFYNVSGIEARRDPFFWQLNFGLQINSAGVSIPFSAVVSQQQKSFTQPFNQFGLSPRYKAVTTHIGYRSMRLSEFSLNGNQFLGLGVEINPEKGLVRGKVLYGRFTKAVDGYYSDGLIIGSPSYERWGYGASVDLGTTSNKLGFVFFRAKDDVNSIVDFQNDATIKPEQNVVFGINTKQKIGKKLSFDAEIDWSAFTRDTRVKESVLEGYTFINNLGDLFYANATSNFSKAIQANLNLKLKNVTTKLGYRRIDPDYQTMGSVYLNNDFEDITAKINSKIFKKKVSLGLSGGLQRNNLDDQKVSEMIRLIGSANLNYAPNDKWSIGVGFANYNTLNRMSLVSTSITEDTLRYAQVTKNANLQVSRTYSVGKNRGAIQGGVNFQNALINDSLNSVFKGAQIGASYSLTEAKMNFAVSLSANENTTATAELLAVGPSLSIGKVLFKNKVNLTLSSSLLKSYNYGIETGLIINSRFGLKYKLNKSHSFFSGVSLAKRTDPTKEYTEIIGTLGYKYNFKTR